jgi:hypothetical protein
MKLIMENWKSFLAEQKEVDWTLYGAPPHGFSGPEWDIIKAKTEKEVMQFLLPFGPNANSGMEQCGDTMEQIMKNYPPEAENDCAQHVVVYRYLRGMKVK